MVCIHDIDNPDHTLILNRDRTRAFCEECGEHWRYPASTYAASLVPLAPGIVFARAEQALVHP